LSGASPPVEVFSVGGNPCCASDVSTGPDDIEQVVPASFGLGLERVGSDWDSEEGGAGFEGSDSLSGLADCGDGSAVASGFGCGAGSLSYPPEADFESAGFRPLPPASEITGWSWSALTAGCCGEGEISAVWVAVDELFRESRTSAAISRTTG
jgi:hypothetical protein